MDNRFKAGDYLFFQLEAGFALLKLLAVENDESGIVWHLATFNELFPDAGSIEQAIENNSSLTIAVPHVAITDRAFESTQVSDIGNMPLTDEESDLINKWKADPNRKVSDRSIRLITGLR
ncbi:MAG: hypothetical protein DMF62_13125 [Acidobacteria bacterium]|nr:MAG: hypothetical protein DMF62_13125 [Acidobacteriota bacterium]